MVLLLFPESQLYGQNRFNENAHIIVFSVTSYRRFNCIYLILSQIINSWSCGLCFIRAIYSLLQYQLPDTFFTRLKFRTKPNYILIIIVTFIVSDQGRI